METIKEMCVVCGERGWEIHPDHYNKGAPRRYRLGFVKNRRLSDQQAEIIVDPGNVCLGCVLRSLKDVESGAIERAANRVDRKPLKVA